MNARLWDMASSDGCFVKDVDGEYSHPSSIILPQSWFIITKYTCKIASSGAARGTESKTTGAASDSKPASSGGGAGGGRAGASRSASSSTSSSSTSGVAGGGGNPANGTWISTCFYPSSDAISSCVTLCWVDNDTYQVIPQVLLDGSLSPVFLRLNTVCIHVCRALGGRRKGKSKEKE